MFSRLCVRNCKVIFSCYNDLATATKLKFWLLRERYNVYVLEIVSQFLLCYNNLAITAKQTLKGTSFNIQNFGDWQERFSTYWLKIAKQFF